VVDRRDHAEPAISADLAAVRAAAAGRSRKGKLVELQALEGGDWRAFSARTYRFRARARAEARFPFVLGVSRSARVRVTP
jgi:hypothetical protein